MTDWKARLAGLAHEFEGGVDAVVGSARRQVRGTRPPRAFLYRGFGTAERVHVAGRVLEDSSSGPAGEKDPRWQNLLATLGRFDSDEVPGARVRLRYGELAQEIAADHEGYFNASLEGEGLVDDADPHWRQVAADVLAPPGVSGTGRVLVPPASARFGVISDLDDTVIQTGVRRVLRLLAATFLENARTRIPFPGVAAFYHALRAGTAGDVGNPIFYVSSSPWNLHDFLLEFMEVRGIPVGPVMLRDWGTSRDSLLPPGHHQHKTESIERVFKTYPALPFILIGDSGQRDPEIYREMSLRHPGRVMAIYIRDVTLNPIRAREVERLAEEVRELGSVMLLVADSIAAAQHAADHGWIARERMETVARDLVETRNDAPAGP